jgi:hypothetical protein
MDEHDQPSQTVAHHAQVVRLTCQCPSAAAAAQLPAVLRQQLLLLLLLLLGLLL